MNLALVSLFTIIKKEVGRFLRIWQQTLLPPIINQSLYFVIFGGFVGSRVGNVDGLPYMAFIVPGLIMMAVTNAAFGNTVSSFFGNKFQRSMEELLVSPTPNWVIMSGFCAGGILRGILVGLIVFVVSFFFVRPEIHNFGIVVVFLTLTASVFSLGGLLNGIFAKKFDDISIFSSFILTPLTYFGGVFYSIKDLPEFWQNISKLNPILYMVDGFRYGFYGQSDLNPLLSLSLLLVFSCVLIVANLYLLKRGMGMRG